MTLEEFRGFLKGNIIKYISRAEHKNGVEDLKKARWYLGKLIKTAKKDEAIKSDLEELQEIGKAIGVKSK